ncbi:MAG: bifunctional phosphoribosylaminoimidazolecarboxamide formyltransferase/IMP cyclohydrolase [Gammaproteobacteria bacterium]
MKIRNALISVSDKTGLADLAKALSGANLYSTGGTAKFLRDSGARVTDTAELTGFDDMLGGRVKTLHPHIHAGILATAEHGEELKKRGVPKIDLVVVNFYPFEKTIAESADESAIIENIDIGGPAMARAAAKNHSDTAVLVSPQDYPSFIGDLQKHKGNIPAQTARRLAAKAFVAVAHLDAAIANYFSGGGDSLFPSDSFLHVRKQMDLAYGENPHQRAACYLPAGAAGGYGQLQGPPLSYNNLLDAQAASGTAQLFSRPAAAIVKHGNPCGAAVAETIKDAFVRARQCDGISAFGGVVAINQTLEEDVAEVFAGMFLEAVIAPQVSSEAKRILAQSPRLRLLLPPDGRGGLGFEVRNAGNLFLAQTPDAVVHGRRQKIVSNKHPSESQMRDLSFAWRVAARVKSNAIVLAKDGATIGIGAGQMSRLDSARIAIWKAGLAKHKTQDAVAASDGFFPFPDAVEELAKAGITAIIQPHGSKKDADIIKAADKLGIALVFAENRHFRH